MTEQEALKRLKDILDEATADENSVYYVTDYDKIPLRLAIESLEKQIPKQVIHHHHCPQCDGGLPTEGITEDYCKCCFKWKYCPNCGQALNWE